MLLLAHLCGCCLPLTWLLLPSLLRWLPRAASCPAAAAAGSLSWLLSTRMQ
jgi:hypothetical protein